MMMITQTAKLNEIIEQQTPALIIFTSPEKHVPEESLLSFFYNYQLSRPFHDRIFVYSIIDQSVYQRFKIDSFPQVVLLKGNQVLFSFVGYNRQKAMQAINLLSQQLGYGRFGKKLSISRSFCRNKHSMSLTSQLNQKKYKNGCFHCRSCDMMSHIEVDKPIVACFECNQFHCYECSHENIRL